MERAAVGWGQAGGVRLAPVGHSRCLTGPHVLPSVPASLLLRLECPFPQLQLGGLSWGGCDPHNEETPGGWAWLQGAAGNAGSGHFWAGAVFPAQSWVCVAHLDLWSPHLYAHRPQKPALLFLSRTLPTSHSGTMTVSWGWTITSLCKSMPHTLPRCSRVQPGGGPGHYIPKGPLAEADNLTTGLKVKRKRAG